MSFRFATSTGKDGMWLISPIQSTSSSPWFHRLTPCFSLGRSPCYVCLVFRSYFIQTIIRLPSGLGSGSSLLFLSNRKIYCLLSVDSPTLLGRLMFRPNPMGGPEYGCPESRSHDATLHCQAANGDDPRRYIYASNRTRFYLVAVCYQQRQF